MTDEAAAPALANDATKLLAAAAHEIKNALGPLAMTLELVERQAVGGRPVAAADVAFARAQVRRLGRLVDDMLDLPAAAEAGRLPLRRSATDVCGVVRDAVDAFRRGHDVVVDLRAPAAPIVANVDEGRLAQVLANLLGNAVRYAGADAPLVVAVDSVRADGPAVRIEVRDRGPGVAPHEQMRIFQPFVRGSSAGETGGLGVGLHLCRAIVEAHGGRIGVNSKPDAGATFWLEIPAD
jgi:signal transduction histidine kinase